MGRRTAAEQASKGNKIRLRSLIAQAYTAEEWLRRYKRLSETDQFRLWAQVEPKEVKMDQSSTFRLVISGLPNKVIDATVIDNKALDEHIDDE
jgi:hypothetical protein